jgi:hypothetical protein
VVLEYCRTKPYSIGNDEAVAILLRSRQSKMAARCVDNAVRDYRMALRIAVGETFTARRALARDLLTATGEQHLRNAATAAPLIERKGTPFYLDEARGLVVCCTLTLSKNGYFAAF